MSYRIDVVAGRLPRESSSQQLAAALVEPTRDFGPMPGRIDEWRHRPHKQNDDAQLSPRAVARPFPWPRPSDRNQDRGAR